jgi:hypothetical protein
MPKRRARGDKAMTKTFHAGPAKIYQFPVKTRSDIAARSGETKVSETLLTPNLAPVRVAKMTFGSAWYHEEAIQEAKAARKK